MYDAAKHDAWTEPRCCTAATVLQKEGGGPPPLTPQGIVSSRSWTVANEPCARTHAWLVTKGGSTQRSRARSRTVKNRMSVCRHHHRRHRQPQSGSPMRPPFVPPRRALTERDEWGCGGFVGLV
jgi:hypothetical protein